MAEPTQLELDLTEVLDAWVIKSQGKKNPMLFIRMLKEKDLEIVEKGDIQKIRHEHKVIMSLVLNARKQMLEAKNRTLMLQTEESNILGKSKIDLGEL